MPNNNQKKDSLRCNPDLPTYDYYACYNINPSYITDQMGRQEDYDYAPAVTSALVGTFNNKMN